MPPEPLPPSPRPPRPYEDAPRLPEGERVDARTLVQGEWLELEVGPGRGGFVFERLAAEPRCGLVGLEVRRKWASIVDARVAKRGFGARGRVFAEDAKAALPRLVPDGVFARAFLHFPDPWWKKRHTKRLVMGDVFLFEVARLVAVGGDLFIQTDVEDRAAQYEAQVLASGWFDPAGDIAGSPRLAENPFNARSPREHRAIADGLPVHRMLFRRNAAPLTRPDAGRDTDPGRDTDRDLDADAGPDVDSDPITERERSDTGSSNPA